MNLSGTDVGVKETYSSSDPEFIEGESRSVTGIVFDAFPVSLTRTVTRLGIDRRSKPTDPKRGFLEYD